MILSAWRLTFICKLQTERDKIISNLEKILFQKENKKKVSYIKQLNFKHVDLKKEKKS